MRKTASRHYAGSPGETVTVSAEPEGSGAVAFRLDGREHGGSSPFVFRLKHAPGSETRLSIALTGETGERCRVRIQPVDGGSDVDILISTTHNPFPMHSYTFTVAAASVS